MSGKIPVAIAIQKIRDLALGFLFRMAMSHLDTAGELVAPAGIHTQIIAGKPAPLLSDLPADPLPAAFDSIPVHIDLAP
jgi:hypothetical protein